MEKLIEQITIALGAEYDPYNEFPDFEVYAAAALRAIREQGFVIVRKDDLDNLLDAVDQLRIVGEAN